MMSAPFFLTVAGFLLAVLLYLWKPQWPVKIRETFSLPVRILENKYGLMRCGSVVFRMGPQAW